MGQGGGRRQPFQQARPVADLTFPRNSRAARNVSWKQPAASSSSSMKRLTVFQTIAHGFPESMTSPS